MPITRNSTGLLFRDQFDRANGGLGADWTAIAGTWSIVSNQVSHDPAADHERIVASVLAARGDMVVQAKAVPTSGGVFPGLFGRWDTAGEHGYLINVGSATDDVIQLYRRQNNAFTQIGANASVAMTAGTAIILKLLTLSGDQKVWVDTVLKLDQADTALDAVVGKAGFRTGFSSGTNVAKYDDFVVCSANTISCSGLPTGWKIRVAGLVAVEAAGTATLDMAGTTFPSATLEVLDGADVVQEMFSGEVWGGDVFAHELANVKPDTPTISIESHTHDSVVLAGSAYSDPEGHAHAGSQWQIDLATGNFSAPVVDSGQDAVNLVKYSTGGLNPNTNYKARVRYLDSQGLWSDWSLATAFETYYAPLAEETVSSSLWVCDSPYGLSARFYDRRGLNVSVIDETSPLLEASVLDVVNLLDHAPGGQTNEWNVVIEGWLNAPVPGQYTFYTTVDDGVRIYMDDVLVRSEGITSGTPFTIELTTDPVKLRLEHWQVTPPEFLKLEWEADGLTREIVPANRLSTEMLPALADKQLPSSSLWVC